MGIANIAFFYKTGPQAWNLLNLMFISKSFGNISEIAYHMHLPLHWIMLGLKSHTSQMWKRSKQTNKAFLDSVP